MKEYVPLLVPIVEALAWPVAVGVFTLLVRELKRRGYQTTYVVALGRAVGAGVIAAHDAGLDPFTLQGRTVLVNTAVGYLTRNVGDAAKELGIVTDAAHAERVIGQLGAMLTQAEATAPVSKPC